MGSQPPGHVLAIEEVKDIYRQYNGHTDLSQSELCALNVSKN